MNKPKKYTAFKMGWGCIGHHLSGLISELYRKAYEGTVEAENLEDVFYIFNMDHPEDYRARSLSMSDVVEVIEDHGSSFHICDTFGFKEVDFDSSKVLEGSQ